MSLFIDWNNLLLREFFSPAPADQDVWLQTSRLDLDSFGLHLGGSAGLIQAVKSGPEWLEPDIVHQIASSAFRLMIQRRSPIRPDNYLDPEEHNAIYKGLNAPTYLPYLALWVLASSEGDGFYDKVGEIVEQPFLSSPDLTSKMESVWKDLEKWSVTDTKGNFGIFKVRVLGVHRFVGIPKSQCMVSRKDLNGVVQLFLACGLRPRQLLTSELFKRILLRGKEAHYLSNSLKKAMQHDFYHEPLLKLLAGMLDSWDGQHPKAERILFGSQELSKEFEENIEEVTLKLAPSSEDASGWDIRWRFPASGNANKCIFVFDSFRIPSILEPSGACFSTGGYQHHEACKAALLKTGSVNLPIGIEYSDEASYDVGGGGRNYYIAKREMRILVWDSPDPRLGEELVERDLPLEGPFYVLYTQYFQDTLERYLFNEKLKFDKLPVGGLPNEWNLICLPNAGQLAREQRLWLSEGNALLEWRARIKFVGGRPIIRGGTKLYAFYDLPTLELEAPELTLPVADGLGFEEIASINSVYRHSPIKRFKVELLDKERTDFEVKAIRGNERLEAVKLRVSIPEGTGVGTERLFCLDNFGRSANSEIGLRGASIQGIDSVEKRSSDEELFTNFNDSLQVITKNYISESISAKFLDSLAQLGSIAYGVARDQIRRMAELQKLEVQPALLLLKLRCAGHLEIETDTRGHMVRIHMVKPTLYSLPITYDGLTLFGVCGSLRLQNWADLISEGSSIAFCEPESTELIPIFRLASESFESMQQVATTLGFQIAQMPSYALTNWAGSLESATSELSSWGWGNLAANLSQLQRLHPATAQFMMATSGLLSVDPDTGSQLFRLDDPSVQGLQVYVLGSIYEDSTVRFSFIHDSKWGIWISISAFAAMLKKKFAFDVGCPWPIHYDNITGCLWLPARLRPPTVIERILAFCSGGGPIEVFTAGRTKDEVNIELSNDKTNEIIGFISPVYAGLTYGVWLCYRCVPRTIADRVASLLGGEIKLLEI